MLTDVTEIINKQGPIISVEDSSFIEIYSVWNKHLWPGRVSKIEITSCVQFGGGFNLEYLQRPAWFWKIMVDNKLAGVNSGFLTEPKSFRSRGLYVFPEYRRLGFGRQLLLETILKAKSLGCNHFWSMPRKSVLPTYESVGLSRCGDFFCKGVEFGPNCFAELIL